MRRATRGIRRALSAPARTVASEAICAHIVSFDLWIEARTVTVYVPMDPEVNVWPLATVPTTIERRIAIPRIVDRSLGAMTFDLLPRVATDPQRADDLLVGAFGIPQARIADEVWADVVDLVIVPATAVDTEGNRLGGGAGYYDRWLHHARQLPQHRPFALGVVFAAQVLPAGSFPVEAHDERLDGLVTEHGFTRFTDWPAPTTTR